MWVSEHKESWAMKNWCFWTVVLEKTLECPLDCKEIKPVNSKGSQFWIFIGRTDAKAEVLIFWPPDMKNWLLRKDLDAGKDWRQEEKGRTEDEMAGWHHQLNGHWVWASSGSWWWTGKPGMLQPMEFQSVGHKWMSELNWADFLCLSFSLPCISSALLRFKLVKFYYRELVRDTWIVLSS